MSVSLDALRARSTETKVFKRYLRTALPANEPRSLRMSRAPRGFAVGERALAAAYPQTPSSYYARAITRSGPLKAAARSLRLQVGKYITIKNARPRTLRKLDQRYTSDAGSLCHGSNPCEAGCSLSRNYTAPSKMAGRLEGPQLRQEVPGA
jgi:hypothetical protein